MADVDDIISARKAAGWTQTEMAERLGMSLRGYQKVEAGETPVRPIHRLAIERAMLAEAVRTRNPMLSPAEIRREALDLAALLRGEPMPNT